MRSAMRAWMTSRSSSANSKIVSQYSSKAGWYSGAVQVATDLESRRATRPERFSAGPEAHFEPRPGGSAVPVALGSPAGQRRFRSRAITWTFSNTRARSSSPPSVCPPHRERWRSIPDEAVAAADRIGYPGRREGAGARGGARQGRRHQAGRRRRRGAAPRAGAILGLDIRGHVVRRLWIERAADIAEEYYAGFTLDRSARKPPGHALGAGRRGHRGGGRHRPRGHRPHPHRPHRGSDGRGLPAVGGRGQAESRRHRPRLWSC